MFMAQISNTTQSDKLVNAFKRNVDLNILGLVFIIQILNICIFTIFYFHESADHELISKEFPHYLT